MTFPNFHLVHFGSFFGLYRCLWIVCRFIDDGQNFETNMLTKGQLILDLYKEYRQFNESFDELFYCISQLESDNSLIDPLNFDLNPLAYKLHVSNCFKLL